MRAHDQNYIFSTGGKFRPDYGLLLELHALTLVARSYALLTPIMLVEPVTTLDFATCETTRLSPQVREVVPCS